MTITKISLFHPYRASALRYNNSNNALGWFTGRFSFSSTIPRDVTALLICFSPHNTSTQFRHLAHGFCATWRQLLLPTNAERHISRNLLKSSNRSHTNTRIPSPSSLKPYTFTLTLRVLSKNWRNARKFWATISSWSLPERISWKMHDNSSQKPTAESTKRLMSSMYFESYSLKFYCHYASLY